MRRTRTLGLLAVVMALSALAGAGTAQASKTTLCEDSDHLPYCDGDSYPKATAIEGTASEVTIGADEYLSSVTCASSSIEATTSESAGEPLGISISSWSLSECKAKSFLKGWNPSCSATAVSGAPYSATLDGSQFEGPGVGWAIDCGANPFRINCTYTLDSSLKLQSGSPGKLVADETALSQSSGSECPGEEIPMTITATYTLSSPDPVYPAIPSSEAPTELCEGEYSPTYCPESKILPSGTTINAVAPEMSFESGTPVVCGETTLEGETEATAAKPLPLGNLEMAVTGCTTKSWGNCTVATESPNGGSIDAYGGSSPFSGSVALNIVFHITCLSGLVDCTSTNDALYGEFVGGAEPSISINEWKIQFVGYCGLAKEAFVNLDLTLDSPAYAVLALDS